MKKFLFTIAAISCMLSCKTSDNGPVPELSLATASIEVSGEGGECTIEYTLTNVSESARPDVSAPGAEKWINMFDLSEKGIIKFNVVPNENIAARQATIKVCYGDMEEKVLLAQSGKYEEKPEYDVEFKATVQSRGIYYGDTYSPSTGNYFITLSDDETSGNQGNYVHANGTYYTIDLYGDMWEGDMSEIGIPEGTYELDPTNSCSPGTFSQKYGEYAKANAEGSIAVSMSFTSGTCIVSKDGEDYRIDLTVTLEDGKLHHVTYKGPIVCEPNSQGPGYEYIEQDITFNINIAQASYNAEHKCVLLQFTDMTADENGTTNPPGTLLNIVAYMDITEEGEIVGTTLVPGEASSATAGTFIPGEMVNYGGVLMPDGTHAGYYYSVTHLAYGIINGGSAKIEGSNGIYDIDIDLVTTEGFHIKASRSSVELPLYGWYGNMSTLTEDYVMNLEGATAKARYFGDYYGTGGDNWMINISPVQGTDGFQLDYVGKGTEGFSNGLPTGTFTASDNGEQGTYVCGYIQSSNLFSTWYLGGYDQEGKVSEFAPAMDGTITVTRNSGNNYTFVFDLYDDADEPNNFSGSWTGDVIMEDASSSSPAKILRGTSGTTGKTMLTVK